MQAFVWLKRSNYMMLHVCLAYASTSPLAGYSLPLSIYIANDMQAKACCSDTRHSPLLLLALPVKLT